jgi:Phytanoyl-CoA dioxygenase (PhyH).
MAPDESILLEKKQRELLILIDHIHSHIGHDEYSSEESNILLSRLLAEVRRIEVEKLRYHILKCPGLNSDSAAFHIACSALDESLEHIQRHADLHESFQLSSSALTASILGKIVHDLKGQDTTEDSYSDLSVVEHIQTSEPPVVGSSTTSFSTDRFDHEIKVTRHRRANSFFIIFGAIFRSLFLDFPLLVTCLFYVASFCSQRIYHTYYVPIMKSLEWTDERRIAELTNYMRVCDRSDISTLNPDDFIIDPNSTTAEEAMEITNKHGMSIFPNLLKPETAAAMREYVLRRNHALTEDDAIWLISNNQRWSFPIGADDDPSVPPVLQEIATNEPFQKAIEALMGEDPAMVEFTAITSAYGAGDQHWHADNDYTASQMHYSRSFVPMYSLFIPLQDTTAQMGATSACPGTHLCGVEGRLSELCEDLNFQVTDSRGRLALEEKDHVWKTGDGFLMNLNTFHRGPGHTDPNGIERVMLILTISPRPIGPHFERRQISLGTSYSCKWDMWGLTMKDLAVMDKIKGFPWKILRTLGIYKQIGTHRNHDVLWGWDYLTVMCSRIVNEQMGFRWDDLHVFSNRIKKNGKLFYYLFGQIPKEDGLGENELWPKYFDETLERCVRCSKISFGICCFLYLITCCFRKRRSTALKRGLFLVLPLVSIGFLWLYAISLSPWGQDIRDGILYRSPFLDVEDTTIGEVTLPVKTDVLFPSRLDSSFLAGHNFIYNQQPGNALYYKLLSSFSVPKTSPGIIVKGIVETIVKTVQDKDGRFLQQNVFGDWEIMGKTNIMSSVQKNLVAQSNPILQKMEQEIKFQVSDTIYGRTRTNVMSHKHAKDNLSRLIDSLFGIRLLAEKHHKHQLFHSPLLVADVGKIRILTKHQSEEHEDVLKEGDIVEGYFDFDGWFKGRVEKLKGRKLIAILFDDGEYRVMSRTAVRKFIPFRIGDKVGVTGSDKLLSINHIYADGQVSVEDEDGDAQEVHVFDLFRV